MRRQLLSLAVLTAFVLPAAVFADKEPADPTKSNLPVELKLVAKKDSYKLSGSSDDLKKALKEAATTGKYPPGPEVEMVLDIRNRSDKEVKIWISGDPVTVDLKLEGKGAVSAETQRFFTREFRLPRPVAIAPGKNHEIAIAKLQYGFRGVAKIAYWTEPGEYELSASFTTGINPAPEGSKPNEEGFARVVLTSNKVKIKVDGK